MNEHEEERGDATDAGEGAGREQTRRRETSEPTQSWDVGRDVGSSSGAPGVSGVPASDFRVADAEGEDLGDVDTAEPPAR